MRALLMFGISALLGAATQLAVSSCAVTAEECGFPPLSRLPERRAAVKIEDASGCDQKSCSADSPIDLSNGTIEITDTQLVIRYAFEGEDREVAYNILPSLNW